MLRSTMLVAGLVLCLGFVHGDEKKADSTKSKVFVHRVSVERKIEDKNFPYFSASTGLGIHVSVPGKHILGIDAPSSKVEKFEDEKGNALNEGTRKTQFSELAAFGKDRSSLVTGVFGNKAPATGSKKLVLKGSLVLVTGTDEKSTNEEEVEVKLNEEKKAGDFGLKITYVPTKQQNFGPSLTVTSDKHNLKGLTVHDGDGNALGVMTFGSAYLNNATKKWTLAHQLSKKADKIKVVVHYFEKTENVTVPVDVSVGLDL